MSVDPVFISFPVTLKIAGLTVLALVYLRPPICRRMGVDMAFFEMAYCQWPYKTFCAIGAKRTFIWPAYCGIMGTFARL